MIGPSAGSGAISELCCREQVYVRSLRGGFRRASRRANVKDARLMLKVQGMGISTYPGC